jgi:carboxylate-amine ligase
MDGPAVDPVLGKQLSASVMVALLLDHVRDTLVDAGELDEVHRLLRDRCTGATRQRLVAAAGLSAVVRQLSLGGNDDR